MGLTVKGIAKLGPGKHADGGGLYLVKKGGSASWIFRYQVGAKETSMGLGPLRDFSLDEARELARDQRRLLHKGTDPLTAKKDSLTAHAKAAAQRISFDEAARKCFDIRSKEWTSKSSKEQFLTSLQLHAYPIIGKKLVADIDVADVVKVLEPIWMTKTVTAQRVRGRIEYILDWAKSLGYRTGENPAVWAGHLELSFPNRSKVAPVEHFAALPFRNVPTFMAELRARQGVGPRAMEFLILCASRTYEVIDAKWSEIDFETLNWTIPKNRMKKTESRTRRSLDDKGH